MPAQRGARGPRARARFSSAGTDLLAKVLELLEPPPTEQIPDAGARRRPRDGEVEGPATAGPQGLVEIAR